MKKHCRLCGDDQLASRFVIRHAPSNISRLLRESELAADHSIELTVYQCDSCGMVQLAEILESDFYDDYVMTVSHSAQMANYQRAQAKDFVEKFDLAGKRVLEVGCGDGFYLTHLAELKMEVAGIEPSQSFRTMAEDRGIVCYGGYVTRETPAPGGPYDAFVTRQVFEHVPDPRDFLLGIRAGLTPDAVGLIEVPSLEQALEHDRFYDFFPDHLNYYSERTLRFAIESCGMLVESIERGMNGEYLVAYVRNAPPQHVERFGEVIDRVSQQLREVCSSATKAGKKVAVWGAGAKGITALAASEVSGVDYVIDSDPHKQGLFMPVSHFPIHAPSRLHSEPVDLVVLTALAYRSEIIRQLREDLSYTGEIAILGPSIEIVPPIPSPACRAG
ncbi:methyltransferase domain-containing protein [bacterium]|nr:methyltransferase domain-containing protein [bacterium]